jgi:hypothetical protein
MRESEFAALRHTIAIRGTVRPVLLLAAVLGWGAGVLVLLLFADLPIAAAVPLIVLAAGFEGIHALHVGVERIGRYLQTEYEEGPEAQPGPRWETAATAFGPALPGGGVDPLFTALFVACTLVNIATALVLEPTSTELAVILALHMAFITRVVWARVTAGRQRSVELGRLRSARTAEHRP